MTNMTQEGLAPPPDVIPHRPPFLFIDRVVDVTETEIIAVRTFRPDEDFFRGHFPDRPIVPGVILVEGMAQTFAYLGYQHVGAKAVYLAGVDRARFRKPVYPGQEVEFRVAITGQRMGLMTGKAEARVEGVKVADAQLSGYAEK